MSAFYDLFEIKVVGVCSGVHQAKPSQEKLQRSKRAPRPLVNKVHPVPQNEKLQKDRGMARIGQRGKKGLVSDLASSINGLCIYLHETIDRPVFEGSEDVHPLH